VQDTELKYTQKGAAVCDFVLASNRHEGLVLRGHDLVAPRRGLRGVIVEGPGGRVVGRLKQDRWTGPEGQTRSKAEIVAEHVEFKPQLKKDGKDNDSAAEAEGKAGETSPEQATEEAELKEAASF
jgi:single-strand DNA-binding protein